MTETDKRFHVAVFNDNTVRFIDYKGSNDLISISFKEHSDAIDCRDALMYQCDLMNELYEENEQLKQKLKKYEEIEELKKEGFIGCYNCKNDRSIHDGVALDGMCCIKELMNVGGYFDTKYHRLPSGTICPCWELEE